MTLTRADLRRMRPWRVLSHGAEITSCRSRTKIQAEKCARHMTDAGYGDVVLCRAVSHGCKYYRERYVDKDGVTHWKRNREGRT